MNAWHSRQVDDVVRIAESIDMCAGFKAEEEGISYRRQADDLGITEAMLRNYRSGTNLPRAEVLIRMARYYGVSSDYLLGLADA